MPSLFVCFSKHNSSSDVCAPGAPRTGGEMPPTPRHTHTHHQPTTTNHPKNPSHSYLRRIIGVTQFEVGNILHRWRLVAAIVGRAERERPRVREVDLWVIDDVPDGWVLSVPKDGHQSPSQERESGMPSDFRAPASISRPAWPLSRACYTARHIKLIQIWHQIIIIRLSFLDPKMFLARAGKSAEMVQNDVEVAALVEQVEVDVERVVLGMVVRQRA